ncbi:UNVERIFIED_ORG: serine phosphatase RsbU (regulator of sigma subunit) [Bacillus sp. 1751]|nr:serine phosphatase RsbU (regulator of sigma subunit) [Bacillus sp. 1751]
MEEIKVKKLFTEAKRVIAAYKKEVKKLNNQQHELKAELSVLEEEMIANVLSQENASVSDLLSLKIQAKEIVQKTEIINILLKELKEEHAV